MSGKDNAQPAVLDGATRTQPFTSQEYIESLRDGREIWIYGERVKDVTTHPAFRNTARCAARRTPAAEGTRKNSSRRHAMPKS
jgi:4-hydroxyphenylacetate 3-monooxygenase